MNKTISIQENVQNEKDFFKSFVFLNKFKKTNWYFLAIGIAVITLVFFVIFYPFPSYKATTLLDEISIKNGGSGNITSGIYLVFGRYANLLYFTNISNIVFGFSIILVAFNNHQKTKNVFIMSLASLTIASVLFWLLISYFINWSFWAVTFTTIVLHFVTFVIGLALLYWMRKDIKKFNTNWIYINLAFHVTYYLFMIILYFLTIDIWQNYLVEKKLGSLGIKGGVTFYHFLNYLQPFSINVNSPLIIILLNIFLFLAFSTISVYSSKLLLKILKIKYKKIKLNVLFKQQ